MSQPYLKRNLVYYDHPKEIPFEKLAEVLKRDEKYTDVNGFEIDLWGGAIHPTKNWIAWVDLHARTTSKWIDDRYYFHIQIDGEQVFEWEVETYNPAFGAGTVYLHWHNDEVIYIYYEKHDMYGVTVAKGEIKHRVNLGVCVSEINIEEDIVRVLPGDRYDGYLKQYRLPDWEELDPLPEAKAREMGLLEDS